MKAAKYFDSGENVRNFIYSWIKDNYTVEDVMTKNKRIKVTVEKAESTRSIKANNFYWGVIVKQFQKQLWPDYTKDMVHLSLREAFMTTRKPQEVIEREISEGRHKTEWFVPSSSSDNIYEFWFYCEQCLNAFFDSGGHLGQGDQAEYQETKGMFK